MNLYLKSFGKVLNLICRNICTQSLVLKKKPRKKKLDPMVVSERLEKAKMKKKKTKLITKQPSDYCEDIWLKDLNIKNLKLYRKTSYGSFRKINISNLMAKLKLIYPDLISNDAKQYIELSEKNSTPKNDFKKNSTSTNDNELALPQMPDFLVKNMLYFPMCNENSQNSLTVAFEEEKDDYGTVDSINFPSVTKILSETKSPASKKKLEDWKQMMIQKLGEKEFQKYSKDLLIQGSKFHHCLKTYLETRDVKDIIIDPEIKGCWNSLDKLLQNISDVKVVEEAVHHPVLMYKGIVDCVANYNDIPCVIEWKKSEKEKKDLLDTHDAPLQLCAYLGAMSWQKSLLPNTHGLVVVAYPSGSPANAFLMNSECCQIYWLEWLKRLQTYWVNKSSILVKKEIEI